MFYFHLHLPHLPVWQCMAHTVVSWGEKKKHTAKHFISLHTSLWVPTGFSILGSFTEGPQSFMVPEGFLQGLTDAVRLAL